LAHTSTWTRQSALHNMTPTPRGPVVMASLAGVRLPAVGEQLPQSGPALAWAEAASAAPTLRQPSTPRMARGRPGAGKWLQHPDQPGRLAGGHRGAVPGSGAPSLGRIRRPLGLQPPSSLNDVAEMQQKLFAGRSEPRPGSGRTTQREAEAFTVPPLPGVELGSSEAISDQSSDTESTSDLSTESLVPSRAGTWRHRARAIDSEVERPPAVSGRVRLAGEPCRPEEGRKPGLPLRPQEDPPLAARPRRPPQARPTSAATRAFMPGPRGRPLGRRPREPADMQGVGRSRSSCCARGCM